MFMKQRYPLHFTYNTTYTLNRDIRKCILHFLVNVMWLDCYYNIILFLEFADYSSRFTISIVHKKYEIDR